MHIFVKHQFCFVHFIKPKYWILFILFSQIAWVITAQPYISFSRNPYILEFNFSKHQIISDSSQENQLYIKQCGQTSSVGQAILPVYTYYIKGNYMGKPEITVLDSILYPNIDLKTFSVPLLRNGQKLDSSNQHEPTINFPDQILSFNGRILAGRTQLSQIQLIPTRYNSSTKELTVYTRIRLIFKQTIFEEAGNQRYQAVFSSTAISKRASTSNPEALLIITPKKYRKALNPFLKWKREKGLQTSIILLSDIAGSPDPLSIRNYIKLYFNDSCTGNLSVLLVGNADDIPVNYGIRNALNDFYYTLLNNEDIFPDISLGRLPVKNVDECENAVNRIINYEQYPIVDMGTDWFRKACVVASNSVIDNQHGIHLTWFFKTHNFTTVDDLRATRNLFTAPEISKAINNGRSWLFYIGHGDALGWRTAQAFTTKSVTQLKNNYQLPVIVSVACANADLDYPDRSFGETWVNTDSRGAIAFIGATEDTPFYLSDTLGKHTLTSYIEAKCQTLGEALNYGKLDMLEAFPNNQQNLSLETMQHFLLLGDPTLQPWTQIPVTPNIYCNKQIRKGSDSFHISIDTSGIGVKNMLICLYNPEKNIQLTATTDSTGKATLYYDFSDSTDFLLTVSGRNIIPVQQKIEVRNYIGMADNSIDRIEVYPNPSHGNFKLILPGNDQSRSINIFTLSGEIVKHQAARESGMYNFTLPAGMYLLQIQTSIQSVSQKVVIF